MSAAAAAAPILDYRLITITDVHPSKTNPRKVFDPKKLEELAGSIRESGLQQPVVVRKRAGAGFELVFGERRWRASKIAGKFEIEAIVRVMNDLEVLKAQTIENDQREDVHPLEQADAYRAMHEKPHNMTIEQIATHVGRSVGFIAGRLKFCQLGESARRYFLEGTLSTTTALLVARIGNTALQNRAAKEIAEPQVYRHGVAASEPLSAGAAAELIRTRYMLSLEGATFAIDDPDLNPGAGPCTTCPKRTGNQAELFADVKSADVCTDPDCYEAKATAAWKVQARAAKAEGVAVLPEKDAKEIFYSHGNSVDLSYNGSAEWARLDGAAAGDPKGRKLRTLLGKKPEGLTLARHPTTGTIVELVPRKGLEAKLKAAGHDFKKERTATRVPKTPAEIAAETKNKITAAAEKLQRELLMGALVTAFAKPCEPIAAGYRAILLELTNQLQGLGDSFDEVAMRRFPAAEEAGDELKAAIEKMPAAELRALLLELVITEAVPRWNGFDAFEQLAKVFKVNTANIAKEAREEVKKLCRGCERAKYRGAVFTVEDGEETDLCTKCDAKMKPLAEVFTEDEKPAKGKKGGKKKAAARG